MDAIAALPAAADPMQMMGGTSALSMKMGPGASLDKTARDFEASFATQMLQPMFEGLGVDATFGGGHGEEVMRSFMLQEYGKIIAKSGKLGIASQVKAEMLRAQEGGHGGKTMGRAAATRTASAANINKAYMTAGTPATTSGGLNVAR